MVPFMEIVGWMMLIVYIVVHCLGIKVACSLYWQHRKKMVSRYLKEDPQAQAKEELEEGESCSESPLALSKRNAPVAEKEALISVELERRHLSELQEVLIVRAE